LVLAWGVGGVGGRTNGEIVLGGGGILQDPNEKREFQKIEGLFRNQSGTHAH